MFLNKKAINVLDWFYIIMILFMVGISVFAAHIVITNSSITKLFQDENVDNITNYSKNAVLSFDNIMLFIIVGLSLFVLISAALIFNHVAFFIIGFFLLCIAITFSAIISNSFWDFTQVDAITASATAFPKIVFLMNHLPYYIAFMGMAATIVAYVAYTKQ